MPDVPQPGAPAAPPVKPTQTNGQPQPPAAPADPVSEAKKVLADAEAKLAAVEKQRRVNLVEAKKFANEKGGLGAKLSEYEQLKKWKAETERVQQQAKMNKSAYLKSLYGDDWYDQIVNERLRDGAPTAETVALEVSRVEEKLKKEFEERDAARLKAEQEQGQKRVEAELRAFNARVEEFSAASLKNYPALEDAFGDAAGVARELVGLIRAEHDRTIQRDEETGAVLVPGKVLSPKEAAELLETHLKGLAKKLLARDKYRAELTGQPKPVNSLPTGAPQLRRTEGHGAPQTERRTLSNDLTATTTGRQPATTDDERRKRAMDAYASARAKAAQ